MHRTRGKAVAVTIAVRVQLDVSLNELTRGIVAGAIAVHRALGPGLLESAYRSCLGFELRRAGYGVESEVAVPLLYESVRLACGYRVDLVVDGRVIVEIKAIREVLPIHKAQVITYLKLTGHPVGLLMNFNVTRMIDGVHRLFRPRLSTHP